MSQRRSTSRQRAIRPKPAKRGGMRLVRVLVVVTALVFVLGLAGAAGLAITGWVVYQRTADGLGDISGLLTQNYGGAKIYDRNGVLLYEFEDQNAGLHEDVPLAKISPWLLGATIATEDASFYSNPGVNVRGLIRAGLENVLPIGGEGFGQGTGGSSITQQLVKNVLIPEADRYERKVDRKFKETVLAIEITRRYTKDQILEWYLNQIYYGNRAYGINAAAQRYFGVEASRLTLAQASMLAGIPQAPVTYDPLLNLEAAKARQVQVLDLMVRNGRASQDEADAARAEQLVFRPRATSADIKAPHWVFYIQEMLLQKYGEAQVYRSGLRVTTTLDLTLQEKGREIIDQRVTEFEKQDCGCHNGSLVAIDNSTGQILAMVGSRDFFRTDIQGENNNAIAIKQPGSALKPAIYLAAFIKGWTPSTIVWDVAKQYPNPGGKPFVPVGPTSAYQGPVTVRTALGSSLNAPAVSAAAYAGVGGVIDTAHRLGISTLTDPENYGVSIATGGANITLLDMTYMYSTLANNGVMTGEPRLDGPRRLDPVALLKVVDGRGRVLYEFQEPVREQVVPAQQAYMVTDILKDDSARSLIYSPGIFGLKDGRPIAAKTGTQQGFEVSQIRSTWNFGYVPDLAVGVWVGNADGTLVRNISSASSSLQIWRDFMQFAVDYRKIPPKQFPTPQGLERGRASVPGAGGCRTVDDFFLSGQAPRVEAPGAGGRGPGDAAGRGSATPAVGGVCRTVKIDTRNGLLAGPDTPAEFTKDVTFVDLPPDADWRPGEGMQLGTPPTGVSTITPTPTPTPTPTAPPTLPPRVVTATPEGGGSRGPATATATPAATIPARVITAVPAIPTAVPITAVPTQVGVNR